MTLERAKGTRDFFPEQKIVRQQIVDTLKNIFERYGFNPLETPLLERYDVLASKYAGGAEILKETFRLKDQGNRELGLRYDLTVPLSRFIGMNPQLKMPFKRYQIGDVFRDGPLKKGRYRSFVQADVDVIGITSVRAEAELLKLTQDICKELKLDVVIKVNNRTILDALLIQAGVPPDKLETTMLSIDKLGKFGKDSVVKELQDKGINQAIITKIFTTLTTKGTNKEQITKLKTLLTNNKGVQDMDELLRLVPGITFDVSLARGLSYYTGTVFEVFLKQSTMTSSIAAGGRYDTMIGKFLGRGDYPAVGISFGVDILSDVLIERSEPRPSTANVYIIPIKTFTKAFALAQQLRSKGINVDLDVQDRNISKNLDYANKQRIPYVIFMGKDELQQKKVKLRDMKTGKEELLTITELVKKLT